MEWWARALLQVHLWWKKVKKKTKNNSNCNNPDISVSFKTDQAARISQNWYSSCHSERWQLIHSHPSFNRQKPPSSGLYENPTSVWKHTHIDTHTGTGSHRVCMQTHARTHMQQSFLSSPLSSILNKASFQCPAPAARGGIQPWRHYLTVSREKKKGWRLLKTDPRLTNEQIQQVQTWSYYIWHLVRGNSWKTHPKARSFTCSLKARN